MTIKHVCQRCGYKHGTVPVIPPPFDHYGKCGYCKIEQHVTDAWRFGIKEEKDALHMLAKP